MNPLHTLTKPRCTVWRVVTVVVFIIFKLDLYTRIHVIYGDITFVVTHVFKQWQKALFIPRQKPFPFWLVSNWGCFFKEFLYLATSHNYNKHALMLTRPKSSLHFITRPQSCERLAQPRRKGMIRRRERERGNFPFPFYFCLTPRAPLACLTLLRMRQPLGTGINFCVPCPARWKTMIFVQIIRPGFRLSWMLEFHLRTIKVIQTKIQLYSGTQTTHGKGGGGGRGYFLVKFTWMCNWMGSHFLDWIEWGLTFVGILEWENLGKRGFKNGKICV